MAGKRVIDTVVKQIGRRGRASVDAIKRKTTDQPVYAEIVNQIQQMIESGELGKGDQLISERELAELFQVSRTSIRKALAILAGRGIIEVSPRKGAYVRHPSVQDTIQPWIQAMLREQNQRTHLAEVRQIVEVQAARLAAERRQPEDITRLWKLHNEVADLARSGRLADHADTAFHVGIVETAQNPFLTELIAVLVSAMLKEMAPSWSYVLATDPTEAQLYIREHEQIVQAIANQDADRAADLMSEHIHRSHQIMISNQPG
jgi:GntR family transcriptional repressor for pyruvate dehydrogenase complex